MYSFLFPEDVVSGLPLMPLNVIRTTVLYSLRIQMSALYVGVFHCSLWFCWFSFTVFYFTVPPPPHLLAAWCAFVLRKSARRPHEARMRASACRVSHSVSLRSRVHSRLGLL